MPLIQRSLLPLVLFGFFLSSCEETQPGISTQDIGNLVWRNNNTLLAFAEKQNFVSSGFFVYKLYETDPSGSLDRQVLDEVTNESVPTIRVSQDGNSAIAHLGGDLFRIDLTNYSKVKLTANVTKVYAISPDLKYVLLTHAGLFQPIKTLSLLDVAGTPRSVREWQVKGLTANQGYWMNDDRISLSLDTATRPFINVYDTSGTIVKTFLDAQTPARSSAYDPLSNSLYVKNVIDLERINVESGARTDIASDFVNMDVQGNSLVYVLNEEDGKRRIYVQNVQTGETSPLSDDVFRYVVLSPDATKLAYLVEPRDFHNEIKVITVTTP